MSHSTLVGELKVTYSTIPFLKKKTHSLKRSFRNYLMLCFLYFFSFFILAKVHLFPSRQYYVRYKRRLHFCDYTLLIRKLSCRFLVFLSNCIIFLQGRNINKGMEGISIPLCLGLINFTGISSGCTLFVRLYVYLALGVRSI